MHHIIYLSWATTPFTNAQLQKLLTSARRRNTALDVTGVLLYGNERFVQVLEGKEEVVREIYARIRQDARHTNFITFVNKPIEQRTFKEWSMAFQLVSSKQFDDVEGYLDPTCVTLKGAGWSHYDGHLIDLLHSFVQP